MFYTNFTNSCKVRGTSPTALLKKLKISTSKLTAWKNGSMPNSEFLIPISECLQVSIDFLLTGKEHVVNTDPLTSTEQNLLSSFRSLREYDKGRIMGKIEEYLIQNGSDSEIAEEFAIKERKAG
jgi:transcriptional regulator with XRE-family HTH domain